MNAIETFYRGYRFRSRLEARWAVFFDSVEIPWRYEEEGFVGPHGDRYLPDFRIYRMDGLAQTPTDIFVEVKGDPHGLRNNWTKHVDLHDFGGCLPGFCGSLWSDSAGLMLLGDIPEPDGTVWGHPIIQHDKGLHRRWFVFHGISKPWKTSPIKVIDHTDPEDDYIETRSDSWIVTRTPLEPWWDYSDPHHPVPFIQGLGENDYGRVVEAYRNARSARFEFEGAA